MMKAKHWIPARGAIMLSFDGTTKWRPVRPIAPDAFDDALRRGDGLEA